MLFTATKILAILALSSGILAQTKYPACVNTCITEHPTLSPCEGNETGSALQSCECAGLVGSDMVKCIQKCPKADQEVYAEGLPDLCRGQLFPGVKGGSGSSSATGNGSSATATATDGDSSATKTGAAGAATSTGAAVGVNGVKGVLAAGVLAVMMV